MQDSFDNHSLPETLKPKKYFQELAGHEMSHGDAWKPPGECSCENCTGKQNSAKTTPLALEDKEFKDMIPIYAAAVISNDHDHQDGIDNAVCYAAAY